MPKLGLGELIKGPGWPTGGDVRKDGRKDGQTDVWKFTPVSYRTSALWGRCPKRGEEEAQDRDKDQGQEKRGRDRLRRSSREEYNVKKMEEVLVVSETDIDSEKEAGRNKSSGMAWQG